MFLQIKHESRESRAEDLASILNLKQISIAKDIKIKRLLGTLLENICKLFKSYITH